MTDPAAEPAPRDPGAADAAGDEPGRRRDRLRPRRAGPIPGPSPSRSPNAFTPQTPAGDAASTPPAPSATTPSPIGSGPPLVNPLSIDIVLAAHTTHARLQWHTYDHWRRRRGRIPLYPGISRYISAYLGSFFLFAGTKAAARVTHHPSATGADFDDIARFAVLNQVVHGAMIVLVAVLTWTLSMFASSRGLQRPLVTAGLVSWVFGAAGMTIAPVFNGFVTVDVARRAVNMPETAETLRIILQVLGAAVDVVEIVGAVGMSGAVLLWSLDLLRGGGATRVVGVLGIVAGAGTLVGLATGVLTLSVAGMTVLLGAWVVWFVSTGVLMALGKA